MNRSGQATVRYGSLRVLIGVSLAALLMSGHFGASLAQASYQQVGTFAGNPGELHPSEGSFGKHEEYVAQWPEEVQLEGLGGMAVNYTGAGGVPAGTIYAVGADPSLGVNVARYRPDRSFSERWTVLRKVQEEEREAKKLPPYERCGPEGELIEKIVEGTPVFVHSSCAARPILNDQPVDVDVDQVTGNVYVYAWREQDGDFTAITEYSADGSEVIARFGMTEKTKTVAESPEKLHNTRRAWGQHLAVNGAGEVYVFDIGGSAEAKRFHRLMLFKPKTPGDYSEYVYAGQSDDIAAGFEGETPDPAKPVTDAAGNVYVAGEDFVAEYDPESSVSQPICSLQFGKGGISGLTVNPLTGEVFIYSYVEAKLLRLSPCAAGTFTKLEAIALSPKRKFITGMAVDPVRKYEPSRPAGILYLGSGTGEGGKTKGSESESSMGFVFAPPVEAAPPVVVAESVTAVTSSSARLEGRVDPKGNPTTYIFQYVTDAAYQANEPGERFAGAGEAPLGGARIEGSSPIPVASTVGGLQPGLEYHFRIFATSHCALEEPEKVCTGVGAETTFRTYPAEAPGLPDRRAYELVSPAQKNGGQVFPVSPEVNSCAGIACKPGAPNAHFPMQSAPDGDAIVYEGFPFSFDEGALIENEYLARRTDSGWQTTNLTPSRLASKGSGGFMAFRADLGQSVIEQAEGPDSVLSSQAPAEFPNLYTQPSAEPASLTPFLTEAPPNREPGSFNRLELSFAGASADFSRLFFGANDTLTEDAAGGAEAKTNLYQYSGGELHLVNIAPGNAATIPGAVFGSGELLRRGDGNIPEVFVFHAISADGSRVFWTSEESGRLYVREGGETLEIPDPNSCATSLLPSKRTCFITASADGSRVLLSDGLLFDVEDLAEEPIDLTQGEGGFEGVAGQSEDLSRIYFADSKVLTGEEENEYGDKAEEGGSKANLYAWHEGATTFIATLPGSTDRAKESWELAPVHRSAAASPDGRWLAFMSSAALTGFDNTGPCGVQFATLACSEVFLYRAETGELTCPSCNRTGVEPRGPSHLTQFVITRNTAAFQPPRYLTDSGRLFFDSGDSLSPFDVNGRVEDVYEFEPEAIGGCEAEEGCVRLISPGRSGVDSNFVTMDPSGKNTFFTSRDRLVEADKDELVDLYDAREGGGLPPEARSGDCQGEACLPSVSAPNDPTPSSASFKGPGNQGTSEGSKRCPKGRHAVTRKGKSRCVRHVKRHHKRHNDRGGAK